MEASCFGFGDSGEGGRRVRKWLVLLFFFACFDPVPPYSRSPLPLFLGLLARCWSVRNCGKFRSSTSVLFFFFVFVLLHTILTWTLSGLALEAKQKQAIKQQGTGPSFFGVKGEGWRCGWGITKKNRKGSCKVQALSHTGREAGSGSRKARTCAATLAM